MAAFKSPVATALIINHFNTIIMKKLIYSLMLLVGSANLFAQYCDPSLELKLKNYDFGNTSFLKDWRVDISPKSNLQFSIVFSKGNIYNLIWLGSDSNEGLVKVSVAEGNVNGSNTFLFGNEPGNLNVGEIAIRNTGKYVITVESQKLKKVCGVLLIAFVAQIPTVIHSSESLNDEQVFIIVDSSAVFQNGDLNNFRSFITKNLKYPESAVKSGAEGKVIVQFVVNSKGDVVQAQVLRGMNQALNNEALRCIGESPKWKPAKQGNKFVAQQFVIPVVFKLK
jgi:TonB family protein